MLLAMVPRQQPLAARAEDKLDLVCTALTLHSVHTEHTDR
jgi:hypothetical protein